LGLLAVCLAVAAGAAFALDRYLVAKRRQEIAAEIPAPNRSSLSAPSILDWTPTLLTPGQAAPRFTLVDMRTGGRISLDDYRGRRPVVLLLGSFGCNVYCGQVRNLIRLHETYKDRAAFLFIAITDAGHPDPEMAAVLAGEPHPEKDTPEARVRLIRKGLEHYKVPFPCLLDEDRKVESAYEAFPQRLVIVGADGLVVFDGGWGSKGGPSNWDLEEVEEHLRSALPGPAS
jgi:hypothetical protein